MIKTHYVKGKNTNEAIKNLWKYYKDSPYVISKVIKNKMAQIKGWIPVYEKGYKYFFVNEKNRKKEVGIGYLSYSKKWVVFGFDNGLWDWQKFFKTKKEALAFAKRWMKLHPYG